MTSDKNKFWETEDEFWELDEEMSQEPHDSGPCGPPVKDRQKILEERPDYPQTSAAGKEIKDKLSTCKSSSQFDIPLPKDWNETVRWTSSGVDPFMIRDLDDSMETNNEI